MSEEIQSPQVVFLVFSWELETPDSTFSVCVLNVCLQKFS